MKTIYFPDSDTALLEFTSRPVVETLVISENIYIDVDAEDNIVSMTIEHAKANASLDEFSYRQATSG